MRNNYLGSSGAGGLLLINLLMKRSLKHKASFKGIKVWDDGDLYEGEWKQDLKMEGKGSLKTKEGDLYEGQWKENKPNGLGKMTFSDGSIYEGHWIDGEFYGGKGIIL